MSFRNTHSLLILGASTRAAAFSALAAGETPRCGERFADVDLTCRCDAIALANYPRGLARLAASAGGGPWMYTGALENQPRMIRRLAAIGPLLGNNAQVLARVRDPFAVKEVLDGQGIDAPEVRRSAEGLPRDGTWLRKSRRSSAGSGVASWIAQTEAPRTRDVYYFQRRIAGRSAAAIFLAARRRAVLLGATRQIMAAGCGDVGEFRYAGSVGPIALDGDHAQQLRSLGDVLAGAFDLCGLFGVDYIDNGREIWPVEVNPRYTASVEVLERAGRFSAVGWHIAACRDGVLPTTTQLKFGDVRRDAPAESPRRYHAKQIITAPCDLLVSEPFSAAALAAAGQWPCCSIADIPRPGSGINAGGPVMTVFGTGTSEDHARNDVERAAAHWRDQLIEAARFPK